MKFWAKEYLFWTEMLTMGGSALPLILPRALLIELFALVVTIIDRSEHWPNLGIEITPFELAGAALSLLLVLRTNAGYERWWEARKLWGGIVNQSRNLAVAALSYGPDDPAWRERVVRWTAVFGHAARQGLRGDRSTVAFARLLGPGLAHELAAAEHMPTAVSLRIGEALREARERHGLDGFGLLRIDQERATLIDHIGGCERILKTPLPMAYRVEIRRLLVIFLVMTPLAVVDRVHWATPAVTLLVTLPLLAIEKIGTELQFPFSPRSLNPLPLDEICDTIEGNLLALLDDQPIASAPPDQAA
jgi:putative membrane protein